MLIDFKDLNASNKHYRKYLEHLASYVDGGLCSGSGSKEFAMSGLMKAIAKHTSLSMHFESPANKEAWLSPESESNENNDDDDETDVYLQANTDLSKLNKTHGSHSSRRTQCARMLKSMIGELPNDE